MNIEKISNEWRMIENDTLVERITDIDKIKELDKNFGYCEGLQGKELYQLGKGNKSNEYVIGIKDRETNEKTYCKGYYNNNVYTVYYKGKSKIPSSHISHRLSYNMFFK